MKTAQRSSFTIARRTSLTRLGLWMAIGLAGMVFCSAHAVAAGYSFTTLATLGDSAPRGGNLINDFEPGAINNFGDVVFGADLGTSIDPKTFFGEGVFLGSAGQISELVRAGGSALLCPTAKNGIKS